MRSAPTLKIWMTPCASVAMLEKFALLKIALCKAPVRSSASGRATSAPRSAAPVTRWYVVAIRPRAPDPDAAASDGSSVEGGKWPASVVSGSLAAREDRQVLTRTVPQDGVRLLVFFRARRLRRRGGPVTSNRASPRSRRREG